MAGLNPSYRTLLQEYPLMPLDPEPCPTDPNSFSNSHQIVTLHSHLDWTADFAKQILTGAVTHKLQIVSATKFLILDTSYLDIHSVKNEAGSALEYELATHHPKFGQALIIQLGSNVAVDELLSVTITYSTTSKCSAIQWLAPEQTAGKEHPYMFTQCQAIHARSILPCQDTPGVKITYSATVTAPDGLRALMSALHDESNPLGKPFKFYQPVKIPSYLIALAIGNIVGERVGPRSTVWSEPQVIKAAAWEFADTELFIKTGEDLLTPYEWGVYDLLLLPASFPYGGMENPCLTFVTPSLLAKDRSLVDVVAHEIAHSWMGNLVTTQNWEHFWLNEGFTVFIERKIIGRLHGSATLNLNAIIGLGALQESVDGFVKSSHPEYTCLCPNLHNQDPDDAFSSVPYEKGFNLLFYLEQLLGGPQLFEPYLKSHVKKFAHSAITTADFKSHLYEFFESSRDVLESVDWEGWFHKPGMPLVTNHFDDSLAVASRALANRWNTFRGNKPDIIATEFAQFNSNQKVMFFETLMQMPPFSVELLTHMNNIYQLDKIGNSEIKCKWHLLALSSNFAHIIPHVVEFVTSIGRMKFVRPIYKALAKVDLQLAKDTFVKTRSFYHPICAKMVAQDLCIN